jgi:SAM-dependent methyltransferase
LIRINRGACALNLPLMRRLVVVRWISPQWGLPGASYDVVIPHHVLEHIDDDRQAMRELFRLLKRGELPC